MSCVIELPPKGADDADPRLVLARNLQYLRLAPTHERGAR